MRTRNKNAVLSFRVPDEVLELLDAYALKFHKGRRSPVAENIFMPAFKKWVKKNVATV